MRKWNLLSAEWANSTDSKLSVPSSICTQTWTSFMTCTANTVHVVHVNSDRSASQRLLNSFPATSFSAGAKMLHSSINQSDGHGSPWTCGTCAVTAATFECAPKCTTLAPPTSYARGGLFQCVLLPMASCSSCACVTFRLCR